MLWSRFLLVEEILWITYPWQRIMITATIDWTSQYTQVRAPKDNQFRWNSHAMISVRPSGWRNAVWLEETKLSHKRECFTGVFTKAMTISVYDHWRVDSLLKCTKRWYTHTMKVIGHFTGCQLHPSKSKLDSLELWVVWKYITKMHLNGARDSLVDAKAQSDIILHSSLLPYLNKGFSIQLTTGIFTKTETREWKKEMEPIRSVYSPWVEITKENDI